MKQFLTSSFFSFLTLSLLFLFPPHRVIANQADNYPVKIIPAYFGQKKDSHNWFVYKLKQGDNFSLEITLINLKPVKISGNLCLVGTEALDNSLHKLIAKTDIFGKPCQEREVSLTGGQRQNLNLKDKVPNGLEDKEYPGYLVIFNQDEVLGLSDARFVIGNNLTTEFSLSDMRLMKTGRGLAIELTINNTGELSLTDLNMKVETKNNWWPGAADEASFVINQPIYPKKSVKINQLISQPSGLFGPVNVLVSITDDQTSQTISSQKFWWSMRKIMSAVVYLGLLILGVVVSFRLIFKGAAGIIYNYLKNHLQPAARIVDNTDDKTDDIRSLIRSSTALDNQTYNQLLIDLRHIVREEMDLNRRLIKAELSQDAAAMVMNLIKQGVLQLDLDPKVKNKLITKKSKVKGKKTNRPN